MTTSLDKLLLSDTEAKSSVEITNENCSHILMDLSQDLSTRLEALNLYYKLNGQDNTIEIMQKLATMYEMSGTKTLKAYLIAICKERQLEAFLQSIVSSALCDSAFSLNDESVYETLIHVYPRLGLEAGTPYKIGLVKKLMDSKTFREKAKDFFVQIINDQTIDSEFRYRTIISLEEKSSDDEKKSVVQKYAYFITEGCLAFLQEERNPTRLKVLAGQYLLKEVIESDENQNVTKIVGREVVEERLLCFAKDESVEYNVRADAADVLLQYGSDERKAKARDIIATLGTGNRNVNLYQNAQNVHSKGVEESVNHVLEFLQSVNILRIPDPTRGEEKEPKEDEPDLGTPITVDFVEQKLLEMASGKGKSRTKQLVRASISRIVMDRAMYSKYHMSLSTVLLKIWSFTEAHEHEEEMRKRLFEEICEMSGTCSSGFVSRLANVTTGFCEVGVKITWGDQIMGNLTGRLNRRIQDMDDLDKQEKVIVEMSIPSGDYDLRKNFLKFFRQVLPHIKEEMYSEFKQYIPDEDFELYFAKAILAYENGNLE